MTINALAPIGVAPPAGLIGWWKGEGNANNSASPDNGVAEGGITYDTGEVGQAFLFPAGSPDVHIINTAGQFDVGIGGGFTVEAWIYPSDFAARPMVEWDTASEDGVHLWSNVSYHGSLYVNITDTSGGWHRVETGPDALTINRWQHVAVTYDKASGIATLYVNGTQGAQQYIGHIYARTACDLYLGARIWSSERWLGHIDEASVYSRALTPQEIQTVYSAFQGGKTCTGCTCTVPPSGLVSWWRAEADSTDALAQNNGIPQGGLSYGLGEVRSAFYLNGTGASVAVAASSSLDVGASPGFSIEGWIQPLDNNARPIIEWDSYNSVGVHLWGNFPSAGNLYANIIDTAGGNHWLWGGPNYIVFGLWHHIALTYEKVSGNVFLYLDGSQVAQSNFGAVTPQTSYTLYLGERVVGGVTPWFGSLDEFSLYNRALSASEISGIYHALGNGKCQ